MDLDKKLPYFSESNYIQFKSDIICVLTYTYFFSNDMSLKWNKPSMDERLSTNEQSDSFWKYCDQLRLESQLPATTSTD